MGTAQTFGISPKKKTAQERQLLSGSVENQPSLTIGAVYPFIIADLPRKGKDKMARKAAAGTGSIRKKTVTRNGKEYTYWEARYTAGHDPGTGKQIQKTITGKTQKEVSKKLKEATAALDAGTYIAPSKMTVGEWLDIWTGSYLNKVKPRTAESYKIIVKNHLKPNLGATVLDALDAHTIQIFYNSLSEGGKPLSAKTIKNIHGVLHKALQQALRNKYISFNPAEACDLPRVEKAEIKPLDDAQIKAFLKAVSGHPYEYLFVTVLFTGMREGEALGLLWDCVDLNNGTITINKQLQKVVGEKQYHLISTKNGKGRSIAIPPYVVSILRRAKHDQLENRLRYADCYEDSGFVFTNVIGQHLIPKSVYDSFKKIAAQIGAPDARFHDLRHSYAVAAIRSGDDIKTIQENLGHATAAFTLDVYGHVTDQMKKESADRMKQFIKSVNA